MAKAIICGKLFDATDGTAAKDKVILIEKNLITGIVDKSGFIPAEGDEICDLSDRFVMPGLFDTHVHLGFSGKPAIVELSEPSELVCLKAVKNAQDDLMGGFTTVRDEGFPSLMGSQAVRDGINMGLTWGPRVFSSALYVTQTGGHLATSYPQDRFGQQNFKPVNTADSPDEVRTACRTMLKMGADQIKIMATGGVLSNSGGVGEQNMSYEEIVAAVEVGRMHSRPVSCHAHGTAGITAAAKAGVTSIEHCTMVDDEGIEYMLKNHVIAVPTFNVLRVLAAGEPYGVAKSSADKAAFLVPRHTANIKKAYDRGVRVVFGTDTGTPLGLHGKQHPEFSLMVKAGISPEDTLLSATRYAAEMLKWEDRLGTIEEGKLADIIAVDGDPLLDMSVMSAERLPFIMKDGVIYKH
jgi:imidazolonepropionase-like amidohydrolase